MDIKIEDPGTFKNALHNGINLFLGSGFSVLARNTENKSLPIGKNLITEIKKEFHRNDLDNLDLTKLSTVIMSTEREKFKEFLKKRFSVKDFDDRYKILEKLSVKGIFTTNIDNLIHKIFENSKERYINDIDLHGPTYSDKSSIDLITLHGSILNDQSLMRFSSTDIASAFRNDPSRWYDLQERLSKQPVLFWGYSVEDPGTLEALARSISTNGGESRIWLTVHPDLVGTSILDYYHALNFHLIIADTSSFLEYLVGEFTTSSKQLINLDALDTKTAFPSEAIPVAGEVFVRPISNFFRGSAPTWSDIFSGSLYKTSKYNEARESIYKQRHTIITGIPACGKTTLLMQLASNIDFQGHKLIVEKLTEERAHLIARKLRGAPALILVDNFTDDAIALEWLSNISGVQVVAADTDYSISNAKNFLSWNKFNVIDVTSLSEKDMQGIRDSIPEPLKRTEYVIPEMPKGVRPSIFEFIQSNLISPSLFERVTEALRIFRKSNPDLAEMLLFVSHTHSCRIPVSMDMALGYWRDKSFDYDHIYQMLSTIGSTISEYQGVFADEAQDYFSTRSSILANAVLKSADGNALKQVLLRFHKNLGTYSICHYNVFVRYAYDSDLLIRAFPNWEEGKQFYDFLYQKEPSPYILQHAALYLSKRDRHVEAFNYIDKSLAQAGAFNWTIKNSHAIILFRANIAFWQKDEARDTLDESMEILGQCFRSDRRKSFHALTYSENAIQYWEKYRDDTARNYLIQAIQWLELIKQEESGLRRVNERVYRLEKKMKNFLKE